MSGSPAECAEALLTADDILLCYQLTDWQCLQHGLRAFHPQGQWTQHMLLLLHAALLMLLCPHVAAATCCLCCCGAHAALTPCCWRGAHAAACCCGASLSHPVTASLTLSAVRCDALL